MKILVPTGYAPTGWGVGQTEAGLVLLTPCCAARVELHSGTWSCSNCNYNFERFVSKCGKNLAYVAPLDQEVCDVVLDWLSTCLGDPDLKLEVS